MDGWIDEGNIFLFHVQLHFELNFDFHFHFHFSHDDLDSRTGEDEE